MSRRSTVMCAAVAVLVGCGSDSSPGAAEDGLREWLRAVEDRDFDSACELLTDEYRQELGAGDGRSPEPSSCPAAMEALSSGRAPLPPPDSAMEVSAWDPSGEALVEVTNPSDGTVSEYWMQRDDGIWFVGGRG